MPLPTESLTPQSTEEEVNAAIEATIRQLISEGRPQEEAVAIAVQSAAEKTGKGAGGQANPAGTLAPTQPVGRSRLRLRVEGRVGGRA